MSISIVNNDRVFFEDDRVFYDSRMDQYYADQSPQDVIPPASIALEPESQDAPMALQLGLVVDCIIVGGSLSITKTHGRSNSAKKEEWSPSSDGVQLCGLQQQLQQQQGYKRPDKAEGRVANLVQSGPVSYKDAYHSGIIGGDIAERHFGERDPSQVNNQVYR